MKRVLAQPNQPVGYDLRGHFSAVIRSDALGHTTHEHDVAMVSSTPKLLIWHATLMASHSRVFSSISVISRSLQPSRTGLPQSHGSHDCAVPVLADAVFIVEPEPALRRRER